MKEIDDRTVEGRTEDQLKNQSDIAHQMLKDGISASNIQQYTELSEAEIAQFQAG